jgi:hypothetical protein
LVLMARITLFHWEIRAANVLRHLVFFFGERSRVEEETGRQVSKNYLSFCMWHNGK